jgi:hypothetical protein
MKKFLAIVLAVICIFSMATVAFAAGDLGHGYTCNVCGGSTSSQAELNKHLAAATCGKCQYCGQGFNTAEEIAEHEYVCRENSITCDYCGTNFDSTDDFDAHIEACKAKYFNIPLAKIVAVIKDIFSKIDFEALLGTVKDLGGKLVGALGNIA